MMMFSIFYFIDLIVLIDNSRNCFSSTLDGALVSKHDADCVFGKAIVSRIESNSNNNITSLSIPNAIPP